jgi:ribosome-associated translation inhibitor RaiA
MKINIQSIGFSPRQELIDFVHQKLNTFSKLYGQNIGSEVCLKLDKSATKDNKICGIRLLIPGNDLLVSAQYKRFEEAVTQAVETLKRQIKKRKTKIIGKRIDIIEIKNC